MLEITYAGIARVFFLGGLAALTLRWGCAEIYHSWLRNALRDEADEKAQREAYNRRRGADILREANRPIYTATRK